jgi:hypothetical protein
MSTALTPRRFLLIALLQAVALVATRPAVAAPPSTQCAPAASLPAAHGPVAYWSTETRCAVVPPGPAGLFGPENFGNKFPGEAAVYMGIVHLAIYDAAAAVDRSSRPAAIATAAYETLVGLQPTLRLDPTGQAVLTADYTAYLARIRGGAARERGVTIGRRVAEAVLARRTNDGLERNPTLADLSPPPPGPGVWQPAPAPAPALGLRLPGVRPLVLTSASQFRPAPPNALTSAAYAADLAETGDLGRADSTTRTAAQTEQALFWTDHDIRQWNDALLRLAADHRLGPVQTARLLAMAHAAGGDAMIACFDAKYHYWFWRPFQAIHETDPTWPPLGATPNFPEYPSAHACHTTAMATALEAFFGTDRIRLTLDSRVTGTTRTYARLQGVVNDVDLARVLVGFHFRSSDEQGSQLGAEVARYVVTHAFQRLR